MIALYRKELRTLLPLQILMILSNSADFFYRPLTERLDEKAWTDISSYIEPGNGGDYGITLVIFALLIAYSAFPREHDEGTIDFLYSLPVSRWAVFFAKAAAGWTVLIVSSLTLMLSDFTLQSQNPQSFVGEQWRLDIALSLAFIESVFAGIILCHGLLISFLRRFGLIPYAIAWWIAISLERISPTYAFLDVTNVLTTEYYGRHVVIPWGELGFHGLIALACLALAGVLWTGRAERASAIWEKVQKAAPGRAALGCATAIIAVAFFVLAAVLFGGGDQEERDEGDEQGLQPVSYQVDRSQTRWFDFTYPANLRGEALPLIKRADSYHERLDRMLGAEGGERVVVDLTDESPHHEGITAWTTMRIGLAGAQDESHLERTFVHELAHTFQFRLSKQRLADNGRSTHFFTEGSAEYLAFELVHNEPLRRASRRVALASWVRHRIRFEVLADDEQLRTSFDPLLVYSMGETWTAALVDACGASAIGDVLRATGRDEAPQGLAPMAFWQDTLQAAGCDIEEVIDEWERSMSALAEVEAPFLEALPRIGGGVASIDGDDILVLASLDREPMPADQYPEVVYLLRVRDNSSVDEAQMRSVEGDVSPEGDGRRITFRVPRAMIRGQRFQFQLGVRFYPRCWPYFEPWQDAAVP